MSDPRTPFEFAVPDPLMRLIYFYLLEHELRLISQDKSLDSVYKLYDKKLSRLINDLTTEPVAPLFRGLVTQAIIRETISPKGKNNSSQDAYHDLLGLIIRRLSERLYASLDKPRDLTETDKKILAYMIEAEKKELIEFRFGTLEKVFSIAEWWREHENFTRELFRTIFILKKELLAEPEYHHDFFAIRMAARRGWQDVIELAFETYPDLNRAETTLDKGALLHDCMTNNFPIEKQLEVGRFLLMHHADMSDFIKEGKATVNLQPSTMQLLLDYGMNPDFKFAKGSTCSPDIIKPYKALAKYLEKLRDVIEVKEMNSKIKGLAQLKKLFLHYLQNNKVFLRKDPDYMEAVKHWLEPKNFNKFTSADEALQALNLDLGRCPKIGNTLKNYLLFAKIYVVNQQPYEARKLVASKPEKKSDGPKA